MIKELLARFAWTSSASACNYSTNAKKEALSFGVKLCPYAI
jgi:hypothetical protein